MYTWQNTLDLLIYVQVIYKNLVWESFDLIWCDYAVWHLEQEYLQDFSQKRVERKENALNVKIC